jgi:CBS domain-containing protein
MPAPDCIAILNWVSLARTAGDVMAPRPLSISQQATAQEAAAFLIETGLRAVPVINEAGRPVGVLSRSDLVRYQSTQPELSRLSAALDEWTARPNGRDLAAADHWSGRGATPVHEIMTPAVVCVPLDAPLDQVIAKMLQLQIHTVFVLDGSDVLVGVVSALDVLRALSPCPR